MSDHQQIKAAWHDAQRLRPYTINPSILAALVPPGGDWTTVAEEGAITRSVRWGSIEVANVNPQGSLDDITEGQIAMGLRAMPVLDTALRTILSLARDGASHALIATIAETAVAYIEMPAPACRAREDDDADLASDDQGDDPF